MSTTMDQIHHIRDLYYQQDKNISQIASETGLNRKTISKYVDMEDFNTPSPTPASEEEHESKLDPFKSLIDEWLEADKLAPRKQRHTAKRIYRRLRDEAEVFNCSYRLVALYVAEKKEKLRLKRRRAIFLWYTILEKHRLTSDLPIFTRMENFIMKQNISFSAFPSVTGDSCSLITAKTWSAFWKGWLPCLNISAECRQKSGLTIPEPLLPRSSKAAGVT